MEIEQDIVKILTHIPVELDQKHELQLVELGDGQGRAFRIINKRRRPAATGWYNSLLTSISSILQNVIQPASTPRSNVGDTEAALVEELNRAAIYRELTDQHIPLLMSVEETLRHNGMRYAAGTCEQLISELENGGEDAIIPSDIAQDLELNPAPAAPLSAEASPSPVHEDDGMPGPMSLMQQNIASKKSSFHPQHHRDEPKQSKTIPQENQPIRTDPVPEPHGRGLAKMARLPSWATAIQQGSLAVIRKGNLNIQVSQHAADNLLGERALEQSEHQLDVELFQSAAGALAADALQDLKQQKGLSKPGGGYEVKRHARYIRNGSEGYVMMTFLYYPDMPPNTVKIHTCMKLGRSDVERSVKDSGDHAFPERAALELTRAPRYLERHP